MELTRSADRLGPPDVPPVYHGGVAYSQAADGREAGFDQVGGVLVASDENTKLDGLREADVQWVFFKSMTLDPDGRLRIVNERRQAFLVDVHTRQVVPA
jgi:hypothetical protein